jgi:hypothetical protein
MLQEEKKKEKRNTFACLQKSIVTGLRHLIGGGKKRNLAKSPR